MTDTGSSNDQRGGLLGGSHGCDYAGEHAHEGCECPCLMCFSFWHANVFRYEDEKRMAAGSRIGGKRR